MPIEWRRGPAWVDGDEIVMDLERSTSYQPLAEREVGVELSRVRTPDEAAAFVERYGLLRWTLEQQRVVRQLRGEPREPTLTLRQEFVSFQVAAEDLGVILDQALTVRRAAGGDADAVARLRAWFVVPDDEVVEVPNDAGGIDRRRAADVYSREERLIDADDAEVVLRSSHDTAERINEGLALDDPTPFVFDRAVVGEPGVEPGAWRLGIMPRTLAGVCYLSVALSLADRQEIDLCEEETCRRPFVVADARQRFCAPACASRARQRRFKARRRAKGDSHGSAPRTR